MTKEDKHYKSDAFEAIHQTAQGLHDIGAIDKKTMREFDNYLTSVTYPAPKIVKAIEADEESKPPAAVSERVRN